MSVHATTDTPLFPADVKTVGVVSISSILAEKALAKGTNLLVQSGYHVKVMSNVKGVFPPQCSPWYCPLTHRRAS